jgi:hypothetical protein
VPYGPYMAASGRSALNLELLARWGFRELTRAQADLLLKRVNDLLASRVGHEASQYLSDPALEQFEAVRLGAGDESSLIKILDAEVPNFRAITERHLGQIGLVMERVAREVKNEMRKEASR